MTTTEAKPLGPGVWLRWQNTCTWSSWEMRPRWQEVWCHPQLHGVPVTQHRPLPSPPWEFSAVSSPTQTGITSHGTSYGQTPWKCWKLCGSESGINAGHTFLTHWTIISSEHADLSQEKVLMPALELSVHLAFEDLRKMFLPQRGDWEKEKLRLRSEILRLPISYMIYYITYVIHAFIIYYQCDYELAEQYTICFYVIMVYMVYIFHI